MKYTLDPNLDSVMRLGYIEALVDVLEVLGEYMTEPGINANTIQTLRDITNVVTNLRKGERGKGSEKI